METPTRPIFPRRSASLSGHRQTGSPQSARTGIEFCAAVKRFLNDLWSEPRASLQLQKFRFNPLLIAMQNRHAALHPKARFARITRIEERHSTNCGGKRLMRVSKNDHIRSLASD